MKELIPVGSKHPEEISLFQYTTRVEGSDYLVTGVISNNNNKFQASIQQAFVKPATAQSQSPIT